MACDDGPGVAAGSSGGSAGGGPAPDTSQVQTYDAFVQRLSETYCARLIVPCCADAKPITLEACVALLSPELREELLEDGGGTYVPARAAACVAAVDKLVCGQRDDDGIAICEQVFDRVAKPGKAPLERCEQDAECGAPAEGKASCGDGFCSSDGGCSPRTCTVAIEVGLGAACSPISLGPNDPGTPVMPDGYLRLCSASATCDVATRVCKTIPKAGEKCDFSCEKGAVCSGNLCVALRPDNAACKESYECASFTCVGGVCAARPVQLCPLIGPEPD